MYPASFHWVAKWYPSVHWANQWHSSVHWTGQCTLTQGKGRLNALIHQCLSVQSHKRQRSILYALLGRIAIFTVVTRRNDTWNWMQIGEYRSMIRRNERLLLFVKCQVCYLLEMPNVKKHNLFLYLRYMIMYVFYGLIVKWGFTWYISNFLHRALTHICVDYAVFGLVPRQTTRFLNATKGIVGLSWISSEWLVNIPMLLGLADTIYMILKLSTRKVLYYFQDNIKFVLIQKYTIIILLHLLITYWYHCSYKCPLSRRNLIAH